MDLSSKKLFINKDNLITWDGLDVCVYLICQMLYTLKEHPQSISVDDVGFLLYGASYNQNNRDVVRKAMASLEKRGKGRKFMVNSYVYDWTDFRMSKGAHYSCIYSDELLTILETQKRNRFNVVKHLCNIVGSFNYNIESVFDNKKERGLIGEMPTSFIAELDGVSSVSASEYTAELEEMKLLYVIRFKYSMNYEDRITNVYSRYVHKKCADKYAEKYNDRKTANKRSGKSNEGRSITQRYNLFIKNPQKYSREEAIDLLNSVFIYNRTFNNKKDICPIEEYIDYKFTEPQLQKIELGLATPQDFLYETLASDHNM